ncbi:N-acetylglucosamine-6-phosphate deacetylase [uncultured Ruthenibacterium sp.]|uniref:N-acetylglucosamine-6-phosphate deacetylase n=1 Tax=uncultured Ruthenibacterium sp. TaxID=1905347 RepID=UPI00349EE6A2
MKVCYQNARIILPDAVRNGCLMTENGMISQVAFGCDARLEGADRTVDCAGMYLSPGFIDIHVHGAGGHDFMEGGDAIYAAARCHMLHGTTSIVPTTLTGSRQDLLNFVDSFNEIELEREGCPHILGLHLEGPYFAAAQAGAQNPAYLRCPEPDEYEEVLRRTNRVRRWSFAVELDGSDRFLQVLHRHNIVTSIAHSDADCRQVMHAHDLGLRCMTHFYSCMTSVQRKHAYRCAGAVEAGYLLDEMFVEVIADGSHLPAELLQLIYKVKGARRICLITDSMCAAGMPDGEYSLGGVPCIKEDGVAKLLDRSAFAGSVATTDMLVRTFLQLTGAPVWDVVRMASLTPAELMGIDSHTGSIQVGKAADLLVFDEEIQVFHVAVGGRIEFSRL